MAVKVEIELNEVLLDGGIEYTNFFNGRLLTAEALLSEQAAQAQRDSLLGQSMGQGVVEGLQVSRRAGSKDEDQRLTIRAGTAINPMGKIVGLARDIDLRLVNDSTQQDASDCDFSPCSNVLNTVGYTSEGLYLLVMRPAQGYRGNAPMVGLSGSGNGCGRDRRVAGLSFDALPLKDGVEGLNEEGFDDDCPRWRYRSRAADLCLTPSMSVAENALDWFTNPELSVADGTAGLFNLADSDVPLALLYWGDTGIDFVDMWAVRRGCVSASALGDWPLRNDGLSRMAAQARLYQFQQQVAEMEAAGIVVSRECFEKLPAAGLTRHGQTARELLALYSVTSSNGNDNAGLRAWLRDSWLQDPVNPHEAGTDKMVVVELGENALFMRCPVACCEDDSIPLTEDPVEQVQTGTVSVTTTVEMQQQGAVADFNKLRVTLVMADGQRQNPTDCYPLAGGEMMLCRFFPLPVGVTYTVTAVYEGVAETTGNASTISDPQLQLIVPAPVEAEPVAEDIPLGTVSVTVEVDVQDPHSQVDFEKLLVDLISDEGDRISPYDRMPLAGGKLILCRFASLPVGMTFTAVAVYEGVAQVTGSASTAEDPHLLVTVPAPVVDEPQPQPEPQPQSSQMKVAVVVETEDEVKVEVDKITVEAVSAKVKVGEFKDELLLKVKQVLTHETGLGRVFIFEVPDDRTEYRVMASYPEAESKVKTAVAGEELNMVLRVPAKPVEQPKSVGLTVVVRVAGVDPLTLNFNDLRLFVADRKRQIRIQPRTIPEPNGSDTLVFEYVVADDRTEYSAKASYLQVTSEVQSVYANGSVELVLSFEKGSETGGTISVGGERVIERVDPELLVPFDSGFGVYIPVWMLKQYPNPMPWTEFEPLGDPVLNEVLPGSMLDQLLAQFEQLKGGEVQLYWNDVRDVEGVAVAPGAYLVFDKGDVAVPVVMADERSEIRAEGYEGVLNADIKISGEDRFRLDLVLIGAWRDLVMDITSVEVERVEGFIKNLKGQLVVADGSVAVVVDKEYAVSEVVVNSGIADAAVVANMTAEGLSHIAGTSVEDAEKEIADAQEYVGMEAWSLTSDSLRLDDAQLRSLANEGVSTRYQLNAALESGDLRVGNIVGEQLMATQLRESKSLPAYYSGAVKGVIS